MQPQVIKVIVTNTTESEKLEGELNFDSGVIKILGNPSRFTHITNEISRGKTVTEKEPLRIVEESAPIEEPKKLEIVPLKKKKISKR